MKLTREERGQLTQTLRTPRPTDGLMRSSCAISPLARGSASATSTAWRATESPSAAGAVAADRRGDRAVLRGARRASRTSTARWSRPASDSRGCVSCSARFATSWEATSARSCAGAPRARHSQSGRCAGRRRRVTRSGRPITSSSASRCCSPGTASPRAVDDVLHRLLLADGDGLDGVGAPELRRGARGTARRDPHDPEPSAPTAARRGVVMYDNGMTFLAEVVQDAAALLASAPGRSRRTRRIRTARWSAAIRRSAAGARRDAGVEPRAARQGRLFCDTPISESELIAEIARPCDVYNLERPHSAIGGRTPWQASRRRGGASPAGPSGCVSRCATARCRPCSARACRSTAASMGQELDTRVGRQRHRRVAAQGRTHRRRLHH